jgi:hypothetical protein
VKRKTVIDKTTFSTRNRIIQAIRTMSSDYSDAFDVRNDLSDSSITVPSEDSEEYLGSHEASPDSDDYAASNETSPSPPSSSSSPLILYSPPTIWGLLRGAAINLILPFINGLMLGFGELLAHEAAFRLGWSGTKVGLRLLHRLAVIVLLTWSTLQIFPSHRSARPMGPGVEIRDDPIERKRRNGEEIDMYTSLE